MVKHGRLPRDIDSYLTKRYYDPSKPGAFTSVSKLYRSIKREGRFNIPFGRIKEWGLKQDATTLNNAAIPRHKKRLKVVAGLTNSLFDCDLMQLNMDRIAKENDGYSYVLVCIDVLSRFARAAAIKSKGADDVLSGFKNIFEQLQQLPTSLRCDNGKEFRCKKVVDYMKANSVNMYYTNASTKANYAESLIKNLKRRLFKMFQQSASYRYIDKLQQIVDSYNNTHHSSIDMEPKAVNESNEQELWFRTYFPPARYRAAFRLAAKNMTRKKRRNGDMYTFKVGDTVRVSHLREPFTRDYDQKYSSEVFTVRGRRLAQGIPTYKLTDFSGEPVTGTFYAWEITKVTFDRNREFRIDKVIRTRKVGGKSQSYVSFEGWPAKYNMWMASKDIKSLKKDK